jgi:hypothetical protein
MGNHQKWARLRLVWDSSCLPSIRGCVAFGMGSCVANRGKGITARHTQAVRILQGGLPGWSVTAARMQHMGFQDPLV